MREIKGIITGLRDDICRARVMLENSIEMSFRYTAFQSSFPIKMNEKVIVTYKDNLMFGFISARRDCAN